MAIVALAGCAHTPAAATGSAALFAVLDQFKDARAMTAPRVGQAFQTRRIGSTADPMRFAGARPPGLPQFDSLELAVNGQSAELDVFPGGDCITRAEAEQATGQPSQTRAIPGGGVELTAARPARVSRAWPSPTYELAIAFSGAGRCATQITVRHQRAE